MCELNLGLSAYPQNRAQIHQNASHQIGELSLQNARLLAPLPPASPTYNGRPDVSPFGWLQKNKHVTLMSAMILLCQTDAALQRRQW